MNERLMMVWFEKIRLGYVRERTKEIGFHKSLMAIDAFRVYFMEDIVASMLTEVPAGCTFKVQHIDVCMYALNLSRYHVVKEVKDAGDEASNNPSFKFGSPTRQDIVN